MGSLCLHFIFQNKLPLSIFLNYLLLSNTGAQPAAYLPFLIVYVFPFNCVKRVWSFEEDQNYCKQWWTESSCSRKHKNMFDLWVALKSRLKKNSFKEWFNILEIHFFFLSHIEMWWLFVILWGSVGPVYLTTVYWSSYDAGCRIVTTGFVFGLCKDTMVKKKEALFLWWQDSTSTK